jgi:uncharacterized protein (UPF0248 family)
VTRATIVRLAEPGEKMRETFLPAVECAAEDLSLGDRTVCIRHDDKRGRTLIPWHRVLRIEYRENEE